MKGITHYINGSREVDSGSLWKWKGIGGGKRKKEDKGFSVAEFLQENGKKLEKSVEGPGLGAGIGCGVGLGLGMVGGFGFGGGSELRMVFGAGIGCGVGLGFGYGQGFGYGFSVESLRDKFFKPKVKSRKPAFLS